MIGHGGEVSVSVFGIAPDPGVGISSIGRDVDDQGISGRAIVSSVGVFEFEPYGTAADEGEHGRNQGIALAIGVVVVVVEEGCLAALSGAAGSLQHPGDVVVGVFDAPVAKAVFKIFEVEEFRSSRGDDGDLHAGAVAAIGVGSGECSGVGPRVVVGNRGILLCGGGGRSAGEAPRPGVWAVQGVVEKGNHTTRAGGVDIGGKDCHRRSRRRATCQAGSGCNVGVDG